MMPRLTPRRSPRRPSSGVENASPFPRMKRSNSISNEITASAAYDDHQQVVVSSSSSHVARMPQNLPRPQEQQNPALPRRRVFSDKKAAAPLNLNNAPLSPSPASLLLPPPFEPAFKSPIPNELHSDTNNSDWTLTPPTRGLQPLVVSAKRLGKDVRRKHSKRRRCRSRAAKNGNAGFCLWQESHDSTTPAESSSDEDEALPFLFSQQQVSPSERKKQYWEWCYGKEKIEPPLSTQVGWSAKRLPPAKGCLSVLRPRRTLSPNARFKTPPTSPEDLEEYANNLSNLPRKNFRVQFGMPQAAEYEVDGPPGQLTPMPSHVTRERYSMEEKQKTRVEEETTQETKQNSAVLAGWEEEFEEPPSLSRRKRNKNRRTSSVFTPSPMLVDKEDSKDTGSNNTTTPTRAQLASAVPSPSAAVLETLASLRMASPANDVESVFNSSTYSPGEAPSEGSAASQQNTVELRVNLQSFHSTGGAMDTRPPWYGSPQHIIDTATDNRVETTQHADTTPTPTNVSLDTIHSVGGALDSESPGSMQGASPVPFDTTSQIGRKADLESSFEEGSFEAANHAEPTDIVKTLLKRPCLDQEWGPADVFRNLARPTNPIQNVLQCLDSCQNGIVACLDDLLEKAKYQANTKSKVSVKHSLTAQKIVACEWKKLELEFLGDLTQAIERTIGEAASLSRRAIALTTQSCEVKLKPRQRAQSLRHDISDLEEKIRQQREVLVLSEAAQAPFSVLHCQASSHLGICGFRLDEYTGHSLQLSFEHVVEGIESRCVFDLEAGSVAVFRMLDGTTPCKQQPVPASHVAAEFHQHFLNLLVDGKFPVMLQTFDLQETILTLSRWLGSLDLATRDLAAVAEKSTIQYAWPTIECSPRDDLHIAISYDYGKEPSEVFLPSKVYVTRNGKNGSLEEWPSDLTATNCLQKFIEVCM